MKEVLQFAQELVPLPEVIPLAEKADYHGGEEAVNYPCMGASSHHTRVVSTAEQKGNASENQY